MGGAGSGRRKEGSVQPFDYEQEFYKQVMQRIPADSVLSGYWKVYKDTAGKNGGTLTAYCGKMEYSPEADLEDELRMRFSPEYGGGNYELRLLDSERKRVETVPPIRITIPGDPTAPGAKNSAPPDILEEETKRGAILGAQQRNLYLQKQIEKLEKGNGDGTDGDPIKAAMADFLRAKINGDKNGSSSARELLELAIVSKSLREPEPAPAPAPGGVNSIENAIGALMSAVTGMVQAQSNMNSTMMQTMNGVMGQSLQMIQMAQMNAQQDPWIVALQMAPDILDRLGGMVVNGIREVKTGFLDGAPDPAGVPAAGAAGARMLPPAAPGAGKAKGNKFLVMVFESYKAKVPPDVTAESVQYFLQEDQIRGIVSATVEDVLLFLEKQGIKQFFDRDPGLKEYVRGVVQEIQKIYEEAAKESQAAQAPQPQQGT